MGWFNWSRKAQKNLVGRWAVDPNDPASLDALGFVVIEFDADPPSDAADLEHSYTRDGAARP